MASVGGSAYNSGTSPLCSASELYNQKRIRFPRRLPPMAIPENHSITGLKTKLGPVPDSPVPTRRNRSHGDVKTTDLFLDKEEKPLPLASPRPPRKNMDPTNLSRARTSKSHPITNSDEKLFDLNETFPSLRTTPQKERDRQATKSFYRTLAADEEKYCYKVEKEFSDLERERLRIQALCRRHRFSSQEFQPNQRGVDSEEQKSFAVEERKRSKDKSDYYKWDFPPPRSTETSKHHMHEESKRSSGSNWCVSSSENISSPSRKKNFQAASGNARFANEHEKSSSEHGSPSPRYAKDKDREKSHFGDSFSFPRYAKDNEREKSSSEHGSPSSRHAKDNEHKKYSFRNGNPSPRDIEHEKSHFWFSSTPSPKSSKHTPDRTKRASEYAWLQSDPRPRSVTRSSRSAGEYLEKELEAPQTAIKDQKLTEERRHGRRRTNKKSNSSGVVIAESNPDGQFSAESHDGGPLKFDVYEFLEYQNNYCFDDHPQSAPPKESRPKRCWFF